MTADKDVVELVNGSVFVNVAASHFVVGKITCLEVVTLNEDVVVLVDSAVVVNVTEVCCRGSGLGVEEMSAHGAAKLLGAVLEGDPFAVIVSGSGSDDVTAKITGLIGGAGRTGAGLLVESQVIQKR